MYAVLLSVKNKGRIDLIVVTIIFFQQGGGNLYRFLFFFQMEERLGEKDLACVFFYLRRDRVSMFFICFSRRAIEHLILFIFPVSKI